METQERRKHRFLAFIDYLGTRALYAEAEKNAELLEDRRYELEHAIQIRLQPYIARRAIEIGLFSDTVLIAADEVDDIFRSAALLLDFAFQKTLDRADRHDIRLLRGGLSRGVELRSSYLRPEPSVHAIPFYDGSLAFAYELEGVRRGSRLFLSDTVPQFTGADLSRYLFTWSYMSGYGSATGRTYELLWPAIAAQEQGGARWLVLMLEKSHSLWRHFLNETSISPEQYRSTLYHFDETIKIFIRSLLAFTEADTATIKVALLTMLPTPADPMDDCNIRYVWGIWFQAILILVKLGLADRGDASIAFTVSELRRRGYYDKFIREADYPDYRPVKELLSHYR